jgi:glycosyltransferase involved in cell wall biosynthesis
LIGSRAKLRVLVSGALPPPVGGMTSYYQTLLNSSLHDQVDLHFVQTSSQKRDFSSSGLLTIANLIAAIQDSSRFTWAILVNHPQISHIGTALGLSFVKHSYCVFIARLFGSRVLLHPHCSLAILYSERSKSWKWFFKYVVNMSNGIVALSKEWLQLRSIVPGCMVYYLPNAIDLTLYHNVAVKRLAQVKREGPCRILYLGYLGEAKGSFDLLKVAAEVRSHGMDMIFDLVGGELSPGEIEQLRNKIRQDNLESCVRLHLPVYNHEKLAYLQNADIFVYPSHHEGMPMAVIEAMACGLPIVASQVGGLPDLVIDGVNGILVEPGQPDRLADVLCRLSKDHELQYSMQKASYQIGCEKYDIEQHVTRLISIYKTILYGSPVE